MTVIIRLQNLPWTANALDIRQFFQGLSIPDGGVHIVGGEKGDAFIAFSTDDDARQAMYMDGQRIRDTPVKLLLSSKTEMQNVIAVARGMAQVSGSANPIAGPGGPQLGGTHGGGGGIAPGLRTGGMVGGPGIGGSQPAHGGFGAADMRDVRAGDVGEYSNSQGQFDGHAGPNRMAGFGGDRIGGPDHMGGLDGGSDRKLGGPDRMGGPDRLMNPDCVGSPDRLMGGPDHMGGFDRMGSGLDRMGGPDLGSRIPAGGSMGSDHMGGPSDRIGGGRLSGGGNLMGGSDFNRLDNPDQVGGSVRRLGGLDRMGGSFDRFSGSDSISGNRMGDFDRMDSFRGPDRLAIPGKNDFVGGGGQFSDRGGPDRFRDSDYDMAGRGNFGQDRREIEDRPVGGGFGQDLFGQRQLRFDDSWDKRHSDGLYGGNNLAPADTDRREGRGRVFPDSFAGPSGADLDSRAGFGRNVPLRDSFDRNGFNRGGTHDGSGRDIGFGERLDPGYVGDYGDGRVDLGSPGLGTDFPVSRRMGDAGFERGHYSRSPGRDNLSRFSPDRNFRGGRGGFAPRGGFHGHEPRKHSRDHDAFVVISNMPTTVNYKDVRRFFHGLEIPREGLKLINDKHGERIGEAFVMFAKDVDSAEALKRTGHMMGHKKVQIRKCSALDFDSAVDSFVPGRGRPAPPGGVPPAKRNRSRSPLNKIYPESCCVILKNLPFKAHKDDVRKFLGHLKIKHGGPFIDIGVDGRPSGSAYVELETKKDQEEAMALHRKVLFGRPVEIYMISKNEYDNKTKRDDSKEGGGDKRLVEVRLDKEEKESKDKDKDLKESGLKDEDSRKYYCVRMRGLPFSTTPQMIRDFFSGLEIGSRGIHIVYTRQGQAAGMAYVEFVTSADCKKAVEKDKQYIGKRYIEISPMAKKDMLEELEKEQQRQNGTGPSSGAAGAIRGSTSTLTMSNLPFKVQLEDIMEFFRGFRAIQDSVRLRYSKDGKPMGDAMVTFTNPHEAQRAQRELNRKLLLGRPIFLSPAK